MVAKILQHIATLTVLVILVSCSFNTSQETIKSPDGKIQITIFVEDNQPYYTVMADNKTVLAKSLLGLEFKDLPTSGKLTMEKSTRKTINEIWKQPFGTASQILNHCNESSIHFTTTNGLDFSIVARAYNDGIAFRYMLHADGKADSLMITAERTEFAFPSNHQAWWIPADEFANESLYRNTPISKIPDANTPITIETNDGFYLSIHEAALLDYSEMTLKNTADSLRLVASLWPEPDGVCARVKLPFQTPWRSIMITRSPGGLIESHLTQNLNEPCAIKDVSWIKPMKFVGIWWGMHLGKYTWFEGPNHGATTQRTKDYIDFAAKHGIEGVLAEGWNKGWETWATDKKNIQDFTTAYSDFNLEEVVKYAKSKNIEFISHHETGGNIPAYESQLDSAFALCQKLGIKALKTGYAGVISPDGYHHHGQYMVRHFQKVVQTAANYQISINAHESIKPTGLDRTWPNLLSQEVIRGNEWNATYRATPPYHAVILPFTRYLAGPADYTPGIFKINHSPLQNKRLYCTLSAQLALYVVHFSPMKMAADMIENYENHPAFQFIMDVPMVWDETKVINAKIGDYITIARRSNDKWFVGSLADENTYQLNIPLSFLKENTLYEATIYGDALDTDWENIPEAYEISKWTVSADDTIVSALSKAGGQAISIIPIQDKTKTISESIKQYNTKATVKMKAFEALNTFGNWHKTHLALNKPVSLSPNYHERFPASGKNALTDGERGRFNFSAGGWQGFYGSHLVATIDLSSVTEIKSISAGFLHSPNDWIFHPIKVTFYVSENGTDFIKLSEKEWKLQKPEVLTLVEIKEMFHTFKPTPTRYVKIIAESIVNCPEWHYGKNQKAWLFCDEIVIE